MSKLFKLLVSLMMCFSLFPNHFVLAEDAPTEMGEEATETTNDSDQGTVDPYTLVINDENVSELGTFIVNALGDNGNVYTVTFEGTQDVVLNYDLPSNLVLNNTSVNLVVPEGAEVTSEAVINLSGNGKLSLEGRLTQNNRIHLTRHEGDLPMMVVGNSGLVYGRGSIEVEDTLLNPSELVIGVKNLNWTDNNGVYSYLLSDQLAENDAPSMAPMNLLGTPNRGASTGLINDVIIPDINYVEGEQDSYRWSPELSDSIEVYSNEINNITIKMNDGKKYSGSVYQVIWQIETDYKVSIEWETSDDQSASNVWGIGRHSANLLLDGQNYTYYINVIENPIASISVNSPINVLEGQTMDNGYDDEGSFGIYYPGLPDDVTVTLKDGTSFRGTCQETVDELKKKYNIFQNKEASWVWRVEATEEQTRETVWKVNETHPVTVTLLNVSAQGFAKVIAPIVDIIVPKVTIIEREKMETCWDDEDNSVFYRYDATPQSIKVLLNDGDSIEGQPYMVSSYLQDKYNMTVYFDVVTNQNTKNDVWDIGEHEATIRFGSFEKTYTVEVIENPIQSLTATDTVMFEGDKIAYAHDRENGGTYSYYWPNRGQFTLTSNTGETFSSENIGVLMAQYNESIGSMITWTILTDQTESVSNVWEVGEHTAAVKVAGLESEYKVNVIPNPIESISIDPLVVYEDENIVDTSDSFGAYQMLDITPKKLHVTMKNGKQYEGNIWSVIGQIDQEYGSHIWFDCVSSQNEARKPWTEGKYTATLSLAGTTTNYEVEVKETRDVVPVIDAMPLAKGKTVSLNSLYKNPTWSSKDANVARVNKYGKVTGEDFGVTSIEANDGNGNTETFDIQVLPAVTSLSIIYYDNPNGSQGDATGDATGNASGNATGMTITVEEDELQLYAESLPFEASNKVTWSSSNTKVATVDATTGLVRRVANGSVTITAKAVDGTGKAASTNIKFVNFVKSLEITGPNEVAKGKSITLKAVMNDDATTKTVTWASSNPSVAKVDKKTGKVTGVAPNGEPVTITATTTDGSGTYAEYDVMVLPQVSSVVIENDDGIVVTGKTTTLEANYTQLFAYTNPSDASDEVKWSSNNTKVATVDPETGEVTRINNGSVVITATALDGTGKKATTTLKFVYFVDKLDITGPTEVGKGKAITLKAVPNADATNKTVKWTSSNPKVAKVDAKTGKVTGVTEGSVTITATAQDGSGFDANYEVNVLPPVISVVVKDSGQVVTGKTLTVEADYYSLDAEANPGTASQDVKWTSSNAKIATVDPITGEVTRVKNGKVTITATAQDGSGKKGTVNLNFVTFVKDLDITGPTEVGKGKAITLKAVPNADATNKTVKWISSNARIAKVDAKTGKVTGVAEGSVTITATAQDGSGESTEYDVTVKPPVTSVVVKDSGQVVTGKTLTVEADTYSLDAEVNPNTASKDVRWTSSNAKIATVDPITGEVTRVKNGKVTITATAQDGSGKKAAVNLNFVTFVKDLDITGPTEIAKGKTVTLKAVPNADATNKTVKWTSDKPSVAKVDAKTGKVTGVAVSSEPVTITATAQDGSGKFAEYEVMVLTPVTSVVILDENDSIITGKTIIVEDYSYRLFAETTPTGDVSEEVIWSSSNTKIATVDPITGEVTRLSDGTVTITATAQDGTGKKATTNIKFLTYIRELSIDGPNEVQKGKKIKLIAYCNADATNRGITWSSSDKKIAKIDSTGRVTGLKPGTVTITVTARDGSGVVAQYTVTVK